MENRKETTRCLGEWGGDPYKNSMGRRCMVCRTRNLAVGKCKSLPHPRDKPSWCWLRPQNDIRHNAVVLLLCQYVRMLTLYKNNDLTSFLCRCVCVVTSLWPVSQKPRKRFGPAKLFLVHPYLNTERHIRLKLLVWRECLKYMIMLRIIDSIRQLYRHKVWDFGTAFRIRKLFPSFEK